MKVAWSVLVGDGRGKTGSIAGTLTRSGPVMKLVRTQIQPNSQAQLYQRAALATASQLWKSTSMAPYRAGWILLAVNHPELDVFNNPIKKTGLNWFTRCNKNRATFGLDPVLEAPTFAAVANPGTLTASEDASPPTSILIDATTPPGASDAVVIKATRCISPGRLAISNLSRIIFTQQPGTGTEWDVYDAYVTKFKTPIVGQQIIFEAYYIDTDQGRAGLIGTCNLIV